MCICMHVSASCTHSNITQSIKCGVRANLRQKWRVPNSRPCNARPMRRYLSPRPGDGGRAANTSGRNVGGGAGGDGGRGGGGNSGRRFGVGPNRPLGGASIEHASHAGDPPTKSQIGGNGANGGMKGIGNNGYDGVGRKNLEENVIGIHRSMSKREGGVSANFKDSHLRNDDVSKDRNSAEGLARVTPATMPENAVGRRYDFVRGSSSMPRKVVGDRCVGDRGNGREQLCIFRGMVFVVHGTGLPEEEEEKASRIVVK